MAMLKSNLCYNKVCYKGAALYKVSSMWLAHIVDFVALMSTLLAISARTHDLVLDKKRMRLVSISYIRQDMQKFCA